MCGILACLQEENTITREQFEKSLEKLKPRGPDTSRILENEKYFLGFCRLATIPSAWLSIDL